MTRTSQVPPSPHNWPKRFHWNDFKVKGTQSVQLVGRSGSQMTGTSAAVNAADDPRFISRWPPTDLWRRRSCCQQKILRNQKLGKMFHFLGQPIRFHSKILLIFWNLISAKFTQCAIQVHSRDLHLKFNYGFNYKPIEWMNIPFDSPEDALSNVFWVQLDTIKPSSAKCGWNAKVAGRWHSPSAELSFHLRPNASPDRLGLKRRIVAHSNCYRLV